MRERDEVGMAVHHYKFVLLRIRMPDNYILQGQNLELIKFFCYLFIYLFIYLLLLFIVFTAYIILNYQKLGEFVLLSNHLERHISHNVLVIV